MGREAADGVVRRNGKEGLREGGNNGGNWGQRVWGRREVEKRKFSLEVE